MVFVPKPGNAVRSTFLEDERGRKVFMDDAQLLVGVEAEDLGGTSVLEVFVGRLAQAAGYARGIKAKGVAGDGETACDLHIAFRIPRPRRQVAEPQLSHCRSGLCHVPS